MRCFVGWIGVIIEHETGSVASANGVGTGSTIKTHAKAAADAVPKKRKKNKKRKGERQHIRAKKAEHWGDTQTLSSVNLPETFVGHLKSTCLGHMLLQKLIQVTQTIRIVLHNADGLIAQTGADQASHIRIAETRQLLGLAAELLAQMIAGAGTQCGDGNQCGTGKKGKQIRS